MATGQVGIGFNRSPEGENVRISEIDPASENLELQPSFDTVVELAADRTVRKGVYGPLVAAIRQRQLEQPDVGNEAVELQVPGTAIST